jgi:hypothetical protein
LRTHPWPGRPDKPSLPRTGTPRVYSSSLRRVGQPRRSTARWYTATRPTHSSPHQHLSTVLHQHGPAPTANAPYNWPIEVWLIANNAGLDSYYNAALFHALLQQIEAACTPGSAHVTRHVSSPSVIVQKPAIFTWLAQDTACPEQRAPRPPRRLQSRGQQPGADAPPMHRTALLNPTAAPPRSRKRRTLSTLTAR